MMAANARKSVKYVYIPVDPTKQMEERTLTFDQMDVISCFIDELKVFFRTVPKQAGSDQAKNQQLMAELQKKGVKQVTPEMISALGQMDDMIGSVPLLQGCTSANPRHIAMYVNDNGKVYGFEHNMRAKNLCDACAANHQGPIYGDAFIAQYYDDGDEFERKDFTLADLDSSSEWFKEARKRNLKSISKSGANLKAQMDLMKGAEYKKGEKVILHGLKSHAKYNEQLGTITGKYIKKKGRWPVKLPDGKMLSVKPDNLRKRGTPAPKDPAKTKIEEIS